MEAYGRLQVLCRQLTSAFADSATDGKGAAGPRNFLVPTRAEYERLYQASIKDPAAFWSDMAKMFHFQKQWVAEHCAYNFDVSRGRVFCEWFKGATTNVCYNALDRWVERGLGGQSCFLWEGNEPGQERRLSYQQVLDLVCQTANWLKRQGVQRGDVVTLYLPMVCELPITMLACARIGALHSVVFAGFSAESLAQRILDCSGTVIVTASGMARGSKRIELKSVVDEAARLCSKQKNHQIKHVLVVEDASLQRKDTPCTSGRDVWWDDEVAQCSRECAVEWVDAEHPLFLLYTSGSTGSPKGVVHTTGGYMVGAGTTMRYLYELRPGDVWWCTADCGWITGHTYITYGPLLSGATCVLFAGVPNHPDASRCWQVVHKYKVQGLLTAPTLIRSLMGAGERFVQRHDVASLRILGVVGEHINEEAWLWLRDVVGKKRCPISDNWWQTETGSVMLSPFPDLSWSPQLPGCAALPFFGVHPVVLDPNSGRELQGEVEGVLAMRAPWPAMARTLYHDHERFESAYFTQYKGYYFTGDGCRRDKDGNLWITGRVDDVLNVSGHRIGVAEVEDALCKSSHCAEAAVVGMDHPIKGQAIYAYVVPSDAQGGASDAVRKDLMAQIRSTIGAHAVPETIQWVPALPKTRSGKVMRRVLRKIAAGEEKDLGDLSTLADPAVVDKLLASRPIPAGGKSGGK